MKIVRDLPFIAGSVLAKHRLDLYLPDISDQGPLLVYVHGGLYLMTHQL
jgi:acetyl esterase/lipase